MDIGQPKDYVVGVQLYLKSLEIKSSDMLAKGPNIKGNVLIHPTAKVDPTAVIGPNVIIGEDCEVGPGTKIYNSTIMAGTKI